MNDITFNLDLAVRSALESGEEIMKIYNSKNFLTELKDDNSPLTIADKKSHTILVNNLSKTALPILSEEGLKKSFATRKSWDLFWMIDPIDGTKEFIKKNGEFTVNIALIDNGVPVLGVVYAPFLKELFFAQKSFGSFKIEEIDAYENFNLKKAINLSNLSFSKPYTIVISRSHMNDETKRYVDEKSLKYKDTLTKSFGSSLKICKVADRNANCYPRFGPTMEWDTAAAHAIAIYSGCRFTQDDEKTTLVYNKKNLLNPYFVVQS